MPMYILLNKRYNTQSKLRIISYKKNLLWPVNRLGPVKRAVNR